MDNMVTSILERNSTMDTYTRGPYVDITSPINNVSDFDDTMKNTFRIGSSEECLKKYSGRELTLATDVYCNTTWDTVLCWPATSAGTIKMLPCPPFPGLDTSKFGFRKCGLDGRWEGKFPGDYSNPKGYTNYTDCYLPEAYLIWKKFYGNKNSEQLQMMKNIVTGTRTMEIVGLWVSLVTSLISLFIFSYFRSLRCHRTRIHRNLFVSMIVQILVRLILYVDQYVAKNGGRDADSTSLTITQTAIVCESLYTLIEYTKSVQFMWMLIEGLYLHNMIAVSVFSGRPNYFIFYGIGWGIPIPFTVAWVVKMTYSHPVRCWFPYYFLPYYWIIEAPRVLVMAINLAFLLNIIRVLVVKLRQSHTQEPQVTKVRKAIKAAIVLLPLLGITNFAVMIDPPSDVVRFGVWSYTTFFLVSFQGFVISMIYCFLNGEVQETIKRHFCVTPPVRWENSLTSIRVYPPPRLDKVQMTLRKKWQNYRHSQAVRSTSLRRLSRSFSVFTSITEVPNTYINQNRRASAVPPVKNGNAVPLLREMVVRRESRM